MLHLVRHHPSRITRYAAWGLVAFSSATSAAGAQRGKAPEVPAGPPLAPFAAERIAVMPAQLLRADSGGLVNNQQWPVVRKEVDDSIGAALSDRGLGKKWAYAADIARMAKRNTPYTSDPYSLGVHPLRGRAVKAQDQVPMLLANNLRSLIAVGDTRYALVPVEVGFIKATGGQRMVVRLILIDGRAGRYMWEGEVASDPGAAFSPAMLSSLAQNVADLVAAR